MYFLLQNLNVQKEKVEFDEVSNHIHLVPSLLYMCVCVYVYIICMSVCEREKERKVSPIVYNGHCFNLSAYYHMHAQNSLCRLKFCTMINLSFSTSYTIPHQYQVEYTQTLLCLLYNIGRHKDNLPAFHSAVSILLPCIHCPLGKIRLFTKCVLSFLQSLMEDNQLFNLELNTDEISFFATSLSTALESDIATANGFTAEEVLTILINLSVIRANQSALQSKEILAVLNIAIQGQNRMRQRLAIHLLLELIGSSMAKVAIPETTIFTLQALKMDSLSDMRTLAHCLLQSQGKNIYLHVV